MKVQRIPFEFALLEIFIKYLKSLWWILWLKCILLIVLKRIDKYHLSRQLNFRAINYVFNKYYIYYTPVYLYAYHLTYVHIPSSVLFKFPCNFNQFLNHMRQTQL